MKYLNKRAKIGIPFNYDESWIGGTYYIKNLIASLNLLPPKSQPDVWLISQEENSYLFIKKESNYKRLNWLKPSMLAGKYEGHSRKIRLLSKLVPNFLKRKIQFDMIYPSPFEWSWSQTVCWIPDFQDKHLPNFFSAEELKQREQQHRKYFETFKHIVFSSHAACQDFNHFYPEAKVAKHVVHFAVFEPKFELANYKAVLAKYKLPDRFFYCPNQFWIHKNHDVVISAVALLKSQGVEAVVVFSGKEHDHRAPGYTKKLKQRVLEEGLQDNILFLGFIPRNDQMVIFQKAICIIQPSLFEGWSTTIEDAKSVSQYVVASRIAANLEQGGVNIEFFNPRDSIELAKIIRPMVDVDPVRKIIDYTQHQKEFADSFMDVLSSVTKSSSMNYQE